MDCGYNSTEPKSFSPPGKNTRSPSVLALPVPRTLDVSTSLFRVHMNLPVFVSILTNGLSFPNLTTIVPSSYPIAILLLLFDTPTVHARSH